MQASPAARDWTLDKYRELCEAMQYSGYQTQRIDDHIETPSTPGIILRHDVDRRPGNAIAMAELEHQRGIQSTYYVRTVAGAYSDELVTRLNQLGHEVGYHYEVLSKAKGDMQQAAALFATELAHLRRFAPVRSAAAHGSPLSPWNNLELWNTREPRDFELIGEAYLQIDYAQVAYYTDTGRSWAATATNLRDRVASAETRFAIIRTTNELIALVKRCVYPTMCIQTHPERWNQSAGGFARSWAFDVAANSAKILIRAIPGR